MATDDDRDVLADGVTLLQAVLNHPGVIETTQIAAGIGQQLKDVLNSSEFKTFALNMARAQREQEEAERTAELYFNSLSSSSYEEFLQLPPPSPLTLLALLNKTDLEAIGEKKKGEQAAREEGRHGNRREAKAHVLAEWQKQERKRSKLAFGTKYAPIVLEKYGVKVSAKTISDKWLPK